MVPYRFDKEKLYRECRAVYETYPTDVEHLYRRLDAMAAENPQVSSFTKKSYVYRVAAEDCELKLFPACPFYAEVDTGRDRNSVTAAFPAQPGIAGWMIVRRPQFEEEFNAWKDFYHTHNLFWSASFTDTAHHAPGYENVLKYGFSGLKRLAEERKERAIRAGDKNGEDFLKNVIVACDAVMRLSERFAEKAEEMLRTETEQQARSNLARIAATARRVPAAPPETFYEALNTVWFTRELCNTLESSGFAVLGHIDRLLYSYYEKDLRAGRITRQEARAFIDCYLAMTDARWDLSQYLQGGTNATLTIGGCDEGGRVIFNDITRMVIEGFMEHLFANPKLQARVSPDHPEEYIDMLGRLAGMGTNVLSVFNDAVLIKAHTKRGKKLEDCRLYMAGGCQEPVVANEVNCRAYTYLNLPQMLSATIFPEDWAEVFARDGVVFPPAWTAGSFAVFYERFLHGFAMQILAFVNGYNHFGGQWTELSPFPLFSATMGDCIENALDITQGGARYNSDSFSMAGFGTLVDSLFAIRQVVYREKRVTMNKLREILRSDFAEEEDLRLYLLNKVPKYGQDNEEIRVFSARVLGDIAALVEGYPNARGGYFEASLFAFYTYDWLKEHSYATADGRHYGRMLSRGVNPSESTPHIDAATLLYSQKGLDYTNYPGGAILYMDLPLTKVKLQSDAYSGILYVFLEDNGCILDFNVVDVDQLLEAQKDPEAHRNIIVRVCGYSAPFYSLPKFMQDEVIQRTQRQL